MEELIMMNKIITADEIGNRKRKISNDEISSSKRKLLNKLEQNKCSIYDDAIEEEKYEWVEKRSPPPPKEEVKSDRLPPVGKKTHELTDDELWFGCPQSRNGQVSIDTVPKKSLDVLRKYYKQLYESEVFDLDENPVIGGGGVRRAQVCENSYPEKYKTYMTLAQFAIDETYNKDNKTDLRVLEVKTVNECFDFAKAYYMTFTAGGSDPKTFQAAVVTSPPGYRENEKLGKIVKCRLKAQYYS